MKSNRGIILICIAVLILSIPLGFILFNLIENGPGSLGLSDHEGNQSKYYVINASPNEANALTGKHILYLGSSVTNGSASLGASFAEYIAKRNNTTFIKEAQNGTTLVENKDSYIERLKKVNTNFNFDLVICQLSTNDATQNLPLGTPSLTDTPDTSTVCGAIEYIIKYVKKTWNCPIVFYTNSYYENENYADMVSALKEIALLYNVGVIDLYTDEEFNSISDEQRKLYMADDIHPTKAGYLEWWTPKMEEYLCDFISKPKITKLEDLTVILHAAGVLEGKRLLNCQEAFYTYYELGYRYFEYDLKLSSDGRLIATHSWEHLSEGYDGISYDEFIKLKLDGGYTPANEEWLMNMLIEYPDVTVIVDAKMPTTLQDAEVIKRLDALQDVYNIDLSERVIPEVFSIEMWHAIRDETSFKYNLFSRYKEYYSIETIIQNFPTDRFLGVALPYGYLDGYYKSNLAYLQRAGYRIFMFDIYDVEDVIGAAEIGADAVYVDSEDMLPQK